MTPNGALPPLHCPPSLPKKKLNNHLFLWRCTSPRVISRGSFLITCFFLGQRFKGNVSMVLQFSSAWYIQVVFRSFFTLHPYWGYFYAFSGWYTNAFV